jgi:hypothetical protein
MPRPPCRPFGAHSTRHTRQATSTRRWRVRQRQGCALFAYCSTCSTCSSAPSSCWRAALASVRAAPRLLRNRPPDHPISESCLAIKWSRCSRDSGTATTLVRAALAMNPAAPLLFGHGPASLPVRKAIGAIVGICRGWRLCRLPTDLVDSTAPLLLGAFPSEIFSHGAIERIDWPNGCRRLCGRRCGWRRWRWRWWCCGERRGWNSGCGLWKSCARPSGGAASAHRGAAEVLLCLGPYRLPLCKAGIAVPGRRCRQT